MRLEGKNGHLLSVITIDTGWRRGPGEKGAPKPQGEILKLSPASKANP